MSLTRKRAFSTRHTASSNIAVNTTVSSLCTTALQVLYRRSRGHSFGKGADGAVPLAGMVFDKARNLYGTTSIAFSRQ